MKRFDNFPVVLSVVAAALVGCGANDSSIQIDGSVITRAQALPQTTGTQFERVAVSKPARNASQLAAVRSPTVDEFFNWAELTFPTLFPVKTSNQIFQVYTYRYYPATDLILAVTGNTMLGLVGVTSSAPRVVPLGNLSDFSCLVLPALCTGTPATIDATSVSTGMSEVAAILAVCTKVGQQAPAPRASLEQRAGPSLAGRMMVAGRVAKTFYKSASAGPLQASTSAPADSLGACGGRLSHPVYSHVNGVTTATNQFDNYCSNDSDTGGKQIINGSVSYVKTGTPSANGPITTKMVSNSPAGLSFVTKNAADSVVTSQTFSFSNYVFTPGVPGGDATAANPDRVQIDEFAIGDGLTGKSYRQTSYTASTFDVLGGGTQMSFSGRGYRSNGSYYDMATTTPFATNQSGDYTGGVFTFTGAGGSTAVATVVPGSKLQATMTVDGKPLTGVPNCTN